MCEYIYTREVHSSYPDDISKNAGKSLVDFTDDVGILEHLIMDGAMEFIGQNTEFIKEAQCMCIQLHTTEQG